MPIGFSDGTVYEDELHLAGGLGQNVHTGRPQITIRPMPKDPEVIQPKELPQGDKPNTPVVDPQLLHPEANESDFEISAQKRALPSSDLSSAPEGTSQDASRIDSKPDTEGLREKIRQGARWIQEKTGIGKESFVEDFLWKLQNSSEIMKGYFEGKIDQQDPAFIGAVTQLMTTAGNMGLATAPLRTNSAGIFGGVLGAARKDPAIKEMLPRLEKALPEEDVTRLTGWWKDPADKKWKFEIPDKGASIDKNVLAEMEQMAKTNKSGAAVIDLDAVLRHDKLFEVYPELQNYKLYVMKDWNFVGSFSQARKEIYVGPSFFEMSDTGKVAVLLHEIQHGIQYIEGFALGGSTQKTPSGQKAAKLREALNLAEEKHNNTAWTKERVDEAWSALNEIMKGKQELAKLEKRAYNEYRNLPGESEAHNVELRYYLDMLNRAKDSPKNTLKDVVKNYK